MHTVRGKVAVLGAAGGIGQPLSLLLKEMPSINQLALYDIANIGMSADLAHISTNAKVSGFSGPSQLDDCLKGSEIVVIPAGVPRKPGMTRDDLFNTNATIVKNLTAACAKNCPNAHILVISNPVNSTVPIAVEVMKGLGVSKPSVFGITTLDIVRAKTFVGEARNLDPTKVDVPVIGGHSGVTIVPLLSRVPNGKFSTEEIKNLTNRIQYGGDEVVKAKAGAGSATLSMAFAARDFLKGFMAALKGETISTIAYVNDASFKETEGYFATNIEIGPSGLLRIIGNPQMSDYEKELLAAAIPQLQKDVLKGLEFAKNSKL